MTDYYRKDEPIHPARWRLLGCWIVLFTALAVVSFVVQGREIDKNQRANQALCAQQDNLRRQVDEQTAYLFALRTGARKPIPGIEEADILSGIQRERDAIRAFNVLHCPAPVK